jgi:predicted Zn-dependent protease
MTAANATLDLTSGTSYLAFTAGANGSFIRSIRLKASPANNTAATVLRIWVNNGSALGTASNSSLFAEIGIPATTANAAAAQPDFVYVMNEAIGAGEKIYLTLGTAPGGSGQFNATVFGGDY